MVNKNFTITRGDSLQFRLNFVDAESLPDQIYFKLKDNVNSQDTLVELTLGHGITKVEYMRSYDFFIDASLTENLQLLNYLYQIIVIFGDDHDTIVEGKLVITPEL